MATPLPTTNISQHDEDLEAGRNFTLFMTILNDDEAHKFPNIITRFYYTDYCTFNWAITTDFSTNRSASQA